MDHAGDIARHSVYPLQQAGFSVCANPEFSRDRHEYSVMTRDSGEWYLLTIQRVQPTEDQLYWPPIETAG